MAAADPNGSAGVAAVKVLKKLSRLALATLIVAADRGGRGRSGVDRLEVDRAAERADRPQPVGVAAGRVARPGVGHDADGAGDRVAAAQRVARRQRLPAAAEHDRVGVLRLRRVVDDEPVEVVGAWSAARRRRRARDGGRLAQPVTRRHHDLAEAAELEVLGDVERLVQADEHALVALEVVGAATGRVTSAGATVAGAARRRSPDGAEIWVWPWNSRDLPVTSHDVAVGDELLARRRRRRCRRMWRDPRRRRVLQVEAAQRRARALVVGDHGAARGRRLAGSGGLSLVPWIALVAVASPEHGPTRRSSTTKFTARVSGGSTASRGSRWAADDGEDAGPAGQEIGAGDRQ